MELAMRCTFCLLASTLTLLIAQPAAAQSDVDQQLGSVHFETSCNVVAQRRFDRAMRYQHSYWYIPAKDIFEEVLKADPTCSMAYWGIALTLLDNPHNAIPQANLAPGLAAIGKAKAMGAKTERERDYIEALELMYADYDKLSHVQRIRQFRDAQEKIAAKYPDDDEAQIAYAITLNTSADLNDKTYAQQLKGCRDSRTAFEAIAPTPGRHALPHSPLRLSHPGGEGFGSSKPLRQRCAGGAARATHALTHLYARWLLDAVD